jgi:hypothetical protein
MKVAKAALWLVAVGAMFWAWRESRLLALATFPGHAKLVDFAVAMLFMFPMYFLVYLPLTRSFGRLGRPK